MRAAHAQHTMIGGTALDSEQLARRIAEIAQDRKAHDVMVIDLRGRSSYTDFLVLASGTSDRHVQAVAELVAQTMEDAGDPPLSTEGLRGGQWALIDFGSVVAHVFHQFTRTVYCLEDLWRDAPRLELEESAPAHTAASSVAGLHL